MSMNKELLNKCEKLQYTHKKSLSKAVYDATVSELRDLWVQYGYANVLGTLAGLWTFDMAVPFFENVEKFSGGGGNIQTIASYYHKAHTGGVEKVNAELMNIWVSMGFRVVLFTNEPENPLDFEYPESVKRVIIPKSDMSARLVALEQHCLEEHVDLFVYHDWTNQNIIWECMLMRMLHIHFTVYCHGHFAWCFKYGKNYLYQPECFKLCSMVFAISETNARFYQMCGCNTYLVQNPIPRELTTIEPSMTPDSNRILLVGRLAPEKYPLEALEIFKKVHDKIPEVVLDVVGDGNQRDAMLDFVARNKLSGSVIFHGTKSASEIGTYYKEAACVLFTSKMEGFPMILLESMAYGLPFIMYEMPYLSMVKDNAGILCAPSGDIEKMSQNILCVMGDSDLREMMRRNARAYFERLSEYNYEDTWNGICKILCSANYNDGSLYTPKGLSNGEAFVLPMLIDEIKVGYKNEIENDIYHMFGEHLLKPVKSVYRGLNKVKRSIFG